MPSSSDRAVFVKNNATNELYSAGDVMTRPRLAVTLETIAKQGADVFYTGELADKIVREVQNRGGIITKQDLASYDVDFREALSIDLGNSLTAFTTHAPSSGPILNFIFNIMQGKSLWFLAKIDTLPLTSSKSGYNFGANTLAQTNTSALFYHRLLESFKFAYAKRSELSDPLKENITDVRPGARERSMFTNVRVVLSVAS